jgi:hypothetical protein
MNVIATLAVLIALTPSSAPQDPPNKGAPPAGQEAPQKKPGQLKPYADFLKQELQTQEGLFKVHTLEDKVYFEIPKQLLGKELLWQAEASEMPAGFVYFAPFPSIRVVAFSRRKNTVHLRNVDHSLRSIEDGAMKVGVDSASFPSILLSFPVESETTEGAAVIDVTKLYTSDPVEFSVKNFVGGMSLDPSRSYLEKVKAFPTNIETRSVLTYQLAQNNPYNASVNSSGLSSASVLVHFSLVQLPEVPMRGRLSDNRVGYFNLPFEEYGRTDYRAKQNAYIARFRLEKKDPSATLSEPVKPITFYLSREVPERWRRAIKLGVEDWQPAFEQAGFKNAIICLEAPSKESDPDWDPEDARYSVIRWVPSMIENAMGPSIQDPRSGETISAHIVMWHNILQVLENWYFVQCAAVDPRAARLPLPQDLMEELVRYVVAHEVGHTLGLEHNFKASSAYTIQQLRDPVWTNQWGNEASIMDYGRFNYVAQPGDKVRLIPKLGPYDHFVIEWGYKPIPQANNSEDERAHLDLIAARQVDNPMLRFGQGLLDPTSQIEELGDDPVEATRLGLLNLRRVVKMILPATEKLGENFSRSRELYDSLIFQRVFEVLAVSSLVGGSVETNYNHGRGGPRFANVPAEKQREAVRFLIKEVFTTPEELTNRELLSRIQDFGHSDRVRASQQSVISTLLAEGRIRRVIDAHINDPKTLGPSELVSMIQSGAWSEVHSENPKTDYYRRNLHLAYLKVMESRLYDPGLYGSQFPGIAKDHLRRLAKELDKALPRTKDKETGVHFMECRSLIERIMKPSNTRPPAQFFSMLDIIGPSRWRFCGIDKDRPLMEGVDFNIDASGRVIRIKP